MESRIKTMRTIHMKYPAPYTQSWNEEKTIMPKHAGTNKKKNHSNNVFIQDPLHSRSWPKENENRKSKKRVGSPRAPVANTQITYQLPFTKLIMPKTGNKNVRSRQPTVPRSISQKIDRAVDPLTAKWGPTKACRAPDPTVPHLKYGLFRPTRRAMNNAHARVLIESNPRQPTRSEMSSLDHSSRKEKRTRKSKGKTESPHMYMFQPTGSRRLSISTPTHLDIRPRDGRRQLSYRNN